MIEVFAFLAAFAAGLINSVAGGGTLISFPVLVALGIPPITANITNTLALCPGYFGGIFAQRKSFSTQKRRLQYILPVSILGGLLGGFLLIRSDEQVFRILIPYLILFATVLIAIQVPVKRWVMSLPPQYKSVWSLRIGGLILLFLSAVYGGYFGAGVSVIVIAILGLIFDDSLPCLNVLKLAISFSVNVAAAVFFIFYGPVEWLLVLVMSVGSIIGGFLGGRTVEKVNPLVFRGLIICIGVIISFVYFWGG